MDKDLIRLSAGALLPQIPQTTQPTSTTIDSFSYAMLQALQAGIVAAVPWKRPSPYSTHRLRKGMQVVSSRKAPPPPQNQEGQSPKQGTAPGTSSTGLDGRTIPEGQEQSEEPGQKKPTQDHRDKVTEAAGDMTTLWKLARWAKNRDTPPAAYTPPIKANGALAHEPHTKARALTTSFFPTPPPADLEGIQECRYPRGIGTTLFTDQEARYAFSRVPNNKAPGPDEVPNEIILATLDILMQHLVWMYNSYLSVSYHDVLEISHDRPRET